MRLVKARFNSDSSRRRRCHSPSRLRSISIDGLCTMILRLSRNRSSISFVRAGSCCVIASVLRSKDKSDCISRSVAVTDSASVATSLSRRAAAGGEATFVVGCASTTPARSIATVKRQRAEAPDPIFAIPQFNAQRGCSRVILGVGGLSHEVSFCWRFAPRAAQQRRSFRKHPCEWTCARHPSII